MKQQVLLGASHPKNLKIYQNWESLLPTQCSLEFAPKSQALGKKMAQNRSITTGLHTHQV